MDLQWVAEYIKVAEEVGLAEVAVEADGRAFRFRRGVAPRADAVAQTKDEPEAARTDREDGREEHVVRSGFVGFFHRGADPAGAPLVKLGDHVTAGQPMGTVEALRTLNEVRAPVSGMVAEILVDNAEAVEYGHPLFVIQSDADAEET